MREVTSTRREQSHSFSHYFILMTTISRCLSPSICTNVNVMFILCKRTGQMPVVTPEFWCDKEICLTLAMKTNTLMTHEYRTIFMYIIE